MGLDKKVFEQRLEEARLTFKLNLGYCNINRLPDNFVADVKRTFPQLTELDLTSNGLTDLPTDLAELLCLRILKVKYNALSAIPTAVFGLSQLETLDVAGNQISVIPKGIERLQMLQHLDVSGNRITSLTDVISRLPHLARLHLENNQLSILPEFIGRCPSLVKLNCSTNLLKGIPPALAELRKIQRLDFANNMIKKVPACLSHLKGLKEFNLRYNHLEPSYRVAADEGLSKFLAFLKQEEEREEAEAHERSRPIGAQAGSYVEFRCKAQIAQMVRTKSGKEDVDNRPWSRYGYTLCKLRDVFYLFGGTVVQDGKKTNSLYWLSMNTMEWHLQLTEGLKPAPRSGHCAVVDPETERMIIFGGRSQERRRLNDTWELDLKTFEWTKQTCEKTSPAPRDNAAAVYCQGSMVVFGGHTSGKRLNDLAVLDLSTYTWSAWVSLVGQPSPRESAALCIGHGHMLFLHGGCSNFGMDDLWVYDQKQQAWTEITCEGRKPPIRREHHLFAHNSQLFLFGGYDELGAPSSLLFRLPIPYGTNFTVAHLEWQELQSDRHFNRNRMALMDVAMEPAEGQTQPSAHLMCFQLGSKMLGTTNDEDATKGQAYFDVFALADLQALAVKQIQPTKLPYPELYSLEGAVSFVTNAIKYETFENELHLPEFLLSPQSTLSFQAGDSLDMATLLVSILIGVGFDAYVVVGYAPSEIVRNDQSMAVCPLLEQNGAAEEPAKAAAAAATDSSGSNRARYTIKQEAVFESQVMKNLEAAKQADLQAQEEKTRHESEAIAAAARQAELAQAHRSDTHDRRLVHAWVLVKAGAREVHKDLFVEVTTGRTYMPASSPYYGIEFVWNNSNFWVCMGMPEPHSDSRLHPAIALFDWDDRHMWEALIKEPPKYIPEAASKPASAAEVAGADGEKQGEALTGSSGVAAPEADKAQPAGAPGVLLRAAKAEEAGVAARQAAIGASGEGKLAAPAHRSCYIEMPFSWVPKLVVPRDMLDMRVPKGAKKIIYRHSEHELFALFGETSKFDGCIERLSIFRDEGHQIKCEDREWYARRKDKLNMKRRFYDGALLASTEERYNPGSAYGVKELHQYYAPNASGENVLKQRTCHYYCSARLEGLAYKDEVVNFKTIEKYEGRSDGLVYRSVTYGAVDPEVKASHVDKPLPIIKMSEKFQNRPEVGARNNVAKRTYYISQDTIRVDYHIPSDRLTNSYRIYCKDGHSHIVEMDPLAPPLDHVAQLEQFQELLQAEKDCMMSVRQSEWEAKELSKVRKQVNEAVTLVTPYYDVMRVNANESDDDEEEVQEQQLDYLSPFLPKTPGIRGLLRDEALKVREACLKALRDRLIERANLIQTRLNEEVAMLSKRQANYQRDLDQLSKDAEHEYEQACEKSTFKIQILEKRLKHHEEQALKKYYDLDHKLRRDPRLAILLAGSS